MDSLDDKYIPLKVTLFETGALGKVSHATSAYLELRPGKWARSEGPHECVTLDFDEDGLLIGVEVAPAYKFAKGDISGEKSKSKTVK